MVGGGGGLGGGGDFEGSEDYTVAVLCCAVLAWKSSSYINSPNVLIFCTLRLVVPIIFVPTTTEVWDLFSFLFLASLFLFCCFVVVPVWFFVVVVVVVVCFLKLLLLQILRVQIFWLLFANYFTLSSLYQWRHDQGRNVWQKYQIRHEPPFFCSRRRPRDPPWPSSLRMAHVTPSFKSNFSSILVAVPKENTVFSWLA